MKNTMQLMEELGLHEGGVENWIPGNAWEALADLIRADEREACKDAVVQAVKEGLQAAIATEREAILKLADSLGWVSVDDIRARGNT